MKATVQWVFVLGYGFYDQMHRVPQHIRKAVEWYYAVSRGHAGRPYSKMSGWTLSAPMLQLV